MNAWTVKHDLSHETFTPHILQLWIARLAKAVAGELAQPLVKYFESKIITRSFVSMNTFCDDFVLLL